MKKDLIMLLEFGGWHAYSAVTFHKAGQLPIYIGDTSEVKDWAFLMPIYKRFLSLKLHNHTDFKEAKTALINADLDAFFHELIQLVKWYNKHPALGLKTT